MVSTTTRDALGHRLAVTGIPKHLVQPLLDIWFRWCSNSGVEWTVKRFKSLKTDLIRQKAMLPPVTPYVRKNKRGEWYGVIGALFRWSKIGEKQFSRVLQALCIYTSEISEGVTTSQMEKFRNAVSCDKPTGLSLDELSELLSVAAIVVGKHKIPDVDNRMVVYRGSPNKIAPLPHGLGYARQDRKVLLDLLWADNPSNWRFLWEHAACYERVFKGLVGPKKTIPTKCDSTSYAGEVHFIQEPGYKLRSVASPYRIHQLATWPLKTALGRVVSTLPWDCTFDQSKAFGPIQSCLKAGKEVYSVDLSSATDYFPLDIQVCVLEMVFGPVPDIMLFRDLSRLTWKSAYGDIAWKRGQPLGLNPSFFAFTLTHGVVLAWLAGLQVDKFFVVGDDVIILDQSLYEKYMAFLDKVGCPFSPEKTLRSTSAAEFAGKVVTSSSVIPQLKWRKMSNDSFLDIAALVGSRARELMTRRQQKVFDAVRHLLPPVGLNMSKPGSNFVSSLLETERFLSLTEQSAVSSLVDLIRPSWHNALDDPCENVFDVDTDTFDEKVLTVFRQTVFNHWMWLAQIADLPEALGLEPRLPLAASPSRVSTLDRYEEILRRLA